MEWSTKDKFSPVMTMSTSSDNNVVLYSGGGEMLKVAEDGFYIRGVKIPADDREAEQVYNAFKEWLGWAVLNK